MQVGEAISLTPEWMMKGPPVITTTNTNNNRKQDYSLKNNKQNKNIKNNYNKNNNNNNNNQRNSNYRKNNYKNQNYNKNQQNNRRNESQKKQTNRNFPSAELYSPIDRKPKNFQPLSLHDKLDASQPFSLHKPMKSNSKPVLLKRTSSETNLLENKEGLKLGEDSSSDSSDDESSNSGNILLYASTPLPHIHTPKPDKTPISIHASAPMPYCKDKSMLSRELTRDEIQKTRLKLQSLVPSAQTHKGVKKIDLVQPRSKFFKETKSDINVHITNRTQLEPKKSNIQPIHKSAPIPQKKIPKVTENVSSKGESRDDFFHDLMKKEVKKEAQDFDDAEEERLLRHLGWQPEEEIHVPNLNDEEIEQGITNIKVPH